MSSLVDSRLYDNTSFYPAFEKDIKHAKHHVIIESPFITTRRMNDLLPLLRKLRRRNVLVIVNTRNPDEHNDDYRLQALLAIGEMQSIGIIVLYTVKHHRKLAIIDNRILWEGSLNILSQGDSCEVMRRIDSTDLASEMIRFTVIEKYL